MEKLKESFEMLEELIRTVSSLISPLTHHDDLNRLTPEFVRNDSKKNPGCYISVNMGAKHTLLPICNRDGYKCPKMIQFSMKMAKKLYGTDESNAEQLDAIMIKLNRLDKKYSKQVPSSYKQAGLKGKSTKQFKQKMKRD